MPDTMTSKNMRIFRLVLWGLVIAVAIGATAMFLFKPPARPLGVTGQTFAMDASTGGQFTQADLVGRPSLVFFGYTFCPDVCPTTLAQTTVWRTDLGLKPDDLRIIFATVDPGRDTMPIVKSYIEGFDPSIIGLVGTPAQTDNIKAAFGVYSAVNGTPDEPYYLVDHTALVYLIGADGSFEGTIAYGEASTSAIAKIKRLVAK